MMSILLALALAADPGVVQVTTKHYAVGATGMDAVEAGQMLEQLYDRLVGHFRNEPPGLPRTRKETTPGISSQMGRDVAKQAPENHQATVTPVLRIEVRDSAKAFQAALRAAGHPRIDGGGYYGPENRTAYLFTQPSAYFTRHLLLHEAVHQFHFLVATGNRKPKASWYTEGLADYFAMHRWDGNRLECGVIPAVSLEDYPAAALAEIDALEAPATDLAKLIAGEVQVSRPMSWALVHFLIHHDSKAFEQLASRLDAGDDAEPAFRTTFGPITPELAHAFREWIATHQQPWSIVWIGWQQWGHMLEGHAETTVGLIIHKQPPDRFAFTLHPSDAPWKAGGVFGYAGEDDFYLLQLTSTGRVQVLRRLESRWQHVFAAPLSPGVRDFAIIRTGDEVALQIGDQPVHRLTAPGRLGLFVDSCRVRFEPSE